MISILVWLLILMVVVGLVYYVADALPVPQPLNRFVKIAVMVIACVVLIILLLQLAGVGVGGLRVPVIVE